MSKGLEKIVAGLELCKLIPAGEFEDSALVWVYDDVVEFLCRTSGCEQIHKKEWQLDHNRPRKIAIRRKCGQEIYPAPTLAEILKKIPDCVEVIRMKEHNHCMKATGLPLVHESSLADCALRLWLKLKGIEVK